MTDDIDHWLGISATAVEVRVKTAERKEPALRQARGQSVPAWLRDETQLVGLRGAAGMQALPDGAVGA